MEGDSKTGSLKNTKALADVFDAVVKIEVLKTEVFFYQGILAVFFVLFDRKSEWNKRLSQALDVCRFEHGLVEGLKQWATNKIVL